MHAIELLQRHADARAWSTVRRQTSTMLSTKPEARDRDNLAYEYCLMNKAIIKPFGKEKCGFALVDMIRLGIYGPMSVKA